MKLNLILLFIFILLFQFSILAQTSSIQFTYDAAGNREGRAIVMEKLNEMDSVIKDTTIENS